MKIVAIGISTGGPSIIEKVAKRIEKAQKGSIVICLHMQPDILESFVSRISAIANLPIEITKDKLELQIGKIYICTAFKNTLYKNYNGKEIFQLSNYQTLFQPNIDIFFESLADRKNDVHNILGIILTGIGDDGVKGLMSLKKRGAVTLASNKESSVIYGMPKRAKEIGATSKVLSLDEIIKEIERFLNE
ncbi:CheB methylesterase domain-containing protein [Nitrosophilus labii]|uniref:CheB methylesterase domain-containing protein n=1 Tax=Nitrosophilus labii TaxID=2706014 RepID=UPI001656A735|nr:CheB methylesterase domain-containing protein [Nitrosophilus labii]